MFEDRDFFGCEAEPFPYASRLLWLAQQWDAYVLTDEIDEHKSTFSRELGERAGLRISRNTAGRT